MEKLSQIVMDYTISEGAFAAGIVTVNTLEGGPPSVDLSYVLPGAKSAISFAVSINQQFIQPYFMKKDHLSLEEDTYRANVTASGISLELANYLEMRGIPSAAVVANGYYRPDTANSIFDMYPNISHRYLAVRAGVGHFGLSGNVITKEAGAAVILGSVVTTAELVPTDPLPVEDNYCDNCKLCIASCASGFMDGQEKVEVTLGRVTFS